MTSSSSSSFGYEVTDQVSANEMDPLFVSSSTSTIGSASNGKLPSLHHFLLSLLVGLIGWYLPKHMLPSEESIQAREIPYQTTKAGDVILAFDYNMPLVDPPTVPSSLLVRTSVWVPFILIVCCAYFANRNHRYKILHDSHAGICSLMLAIGFSEGLTQILKLVVLRRRPNFYHLCQFSIQTKRCTADFHHVLEAQMSFPSGHTSLSFCGMTVLVWFFLGRLNYPWSRNKVLYLTCFLPWVYACLVGVSRIVDHWHHPSDVLAGFALGTMCATISYHLWYPPVLSGDSGVPYSYVKGSNKLPSFYE